MFLTTSASECIIYKQRLKDLLKKKKKHHPKFHVNYLGIQVIHYTFLLCLLNMCKYKT